MVQSTVGDSIIGALTSLGGIAGRRAQDGLTAAQAEGEALKNEASKRVLESDTEGKLAGRAFAQGFFKNNDAGGVDADFVGMAEKDSSLFAEIMGSQLNKGWLTTKDKDGKPVKLEFAGIRKVPPQMSAAPAAAPAQAIGSPPTQGEQNKQWLNNQTGPVSLMSPIQPPQNSAAAATPEAPAADPAPDRYMVMVRRPDGQVVPAQQGATDDPKDPLIIMTADEINGIGKNRIASMHAKGAFANVAVKDAMGLDLIATTDAYMRDKLLDAGSDPITDDDAAKRELFGAINAASGDDLVQIAKDYGFDPEQIRKDAFNDWIKTHKAKTASVKVSPTDLVEYNDSKSLLERLASQGDQAVNDYVKEYYSKPQPKVEEPKTLAEMKERWGPQMTEQQLRDRGGVSPAPATPDTPEYRKLVAARDSANKKLMELKPPVAKTVMPDNVPAPKFEFTDENIRASLRGALDKPTPEQTAALAKYAKGEGVTKASDISKLPPLRAKALAWVIANNSADPMATFEKLNNYIQTEDTSRSAIQANVDIAGAQAQQGQVANQARAIDESIRNNNMDYAVGMAGIAQKDRDYLHTVYKDKQDVLSKIDDAAGKVAPLLNTIYKGTLVEGNKFNPNGPTQEALAAWKELDSTVDLPPGSPLQYAGSKRYLEGLMTMAAAQAMKPGAAAWWDWTKIFANTFLREDGMVDLSPLVEQAYVKKWKNGLPEEIAFSEGGARSGKPTITVGAAEFSRYMGTSGMKKFMDSIYFQKAANALGSGAEPEAIAAKSEELKVADGYTP